jgi:hypothetical protein
VFWALVCLAALAIAIAMRVPEPFCSKSLELTQEILQTYRFAIRSDSSDYLKG